MRKRRQRKIWRRGFDLLQEARHLRHMAATGASTRAIAERTFMWTWRAEGRLFNFFVKQARKGWDDRFDNRVPPRREQSMSNLYIPVRDFLEAVEGANLELVLAHPDVYPYFIRLQEAFEESDYFKPTTPEEPKSPGTYDNPSMQDRKDLNHA